MTDQKQPVIFLMGPTASGKTDTAIKLVETLNCEIISVDSAMVYRYMDIGTAKPSTAELAIAPHHLIDICDPAEPYSVGQFCRDAHGCINLVYSKGKIPLLVGGTMLYFRQLQHGFNDMPTTDLAIRKQVSDEAATAGWPAMHEKLQQCDPITAQALHPNDAQRISRALEVYYSSGRTLSDWKEKQQLNPLSANIINITLSPADRSVLHQRIEQRFDLMLKAGFEKEVHDLYHRGDLSATLPSMRTVGYRQMWAYLAGEYDHATMRERAIIATRQLAKRQLTWLRSWHGANWYDPQNSTTFNSILKVISEHAKIN